MLREVRSKTVTISNYSLQVRALPKVRSRVPSIRCSGTRERRCSVTRDSGGFHVDHLKSLNVQARATSAAQGLFDRF